MSHHLTSTLLILLSVEYIGVFFAVLADLVSGVRRARREGRACSSRGLRRSVAKLSSYYLALFCLTVVDGMLIAAVIALASLERTTVPPFPYLTTLGSLSFALIEAKSIAENSPHRTDIFNAINMLLSLLRKK